MSVLIDVIVIALSCATVYFSAKQGFVRIFVGVLGYLLAFIIATAISKPISTAVYENMVKPTVVENISKSLPDTSGIAESAEAVDQSLDEIFDNIPDFAAEYLENSGLSRNDIADSVNGIVSADAESISEGIADSLVKPIVLNLLEMIVFLILLTILTAAFRVVSKPLRRVKNIPLIGPLNSFLGGVLGILRASITIYVLAAAVKMFVVLTGNENTFLNETVIGSTYIFNIFYKYNLFSGI